MFKNFNLLHQNGKILYSKNISGEKLDSSFSLVFASSILNFSKTLLGEEVREVTTLKSRVYLKEVGEFIMVLHCALRLNQGIAQIVLQEMKELLELLYGPCKLWDAEGQVFDVTGAEDLLAMYLTQTTFDPYVITRGINRAFVSSDVTDRLDKLLGSLETQQQICGNGSMISCGSSVIHSRLAWDETRKIMQFLKARPLGGASVRFAPIYTKEGWHTLYFVRVQTFVLTVLCYMEIPLATIQPQINLFENALIQSRLELPSEETPILLRLFVKRETLALLYFNPKSQTTIFPSLRPGTEAQQAEILDEFWNFYGEASIHLNATGVTEYTAVRDTYRFYCRSEGLHRIYLLLANDSLSSEPAQITSEALRNLRLYIGGH